ncbi:MAG: sporulation protein YjcZ [bacterium]|nr:sporulation protein YjcZ [bacterium]
MMQNFWNMMGYGGYSGGCGLFGGTGFITMLLVWIVLALVIAMLWKNLNK